MDQLNFVEIGAKLGMFFVPFLFALCFHEFSHGWVAKLRGDDTAERAGRLSLNPLVHADVIGTWVLPISAILFGSPFFFGWAKPVPVVAERLGHPRRDMMLVGAAGPGLNLIMAAIAALVLGIVLRPYGAVQEPSGVIGFIVLNLFNFISINVFLALFNLLPIPPFDGSHIVEGLLPMPLARGYAKFRPVGMLIPLVLIVVLPNLIPGFSVTQYIVGPVEWVINWYARLAGLVAGV